MDLLGESWFLVTLAAWRRDDGGTQIRRTVFAGDDRLAVLRDAYGRRLVLQWHLLIAMEQDFGNGQVDGFPHDR